jgi:hypothetical protein
MYSKYGQKFYIGGIDQEVQGAQLYDYVAIMYSGCKARTNFNYSKLDILKMLVKIDAMENNNNLDMENFVKESKVFYRPCGKMIDEDDV